jgi:hypothetical protein
MIGLFGMSPGRTVYPLLLAYSTFLQDLFSVTLTTPTA